jgi:DNA-binding beta-propeller fold protein YncE
MTRASFAFVACVSLLAFVGCGEEPVDTTSRNLNRPGPLAMTCAGRVDDNAVGLAASYCKADSTSSVEGFLYGFVANTTAGTVSMFRVADDKTELIDLNPATPGYGVIPVGSFPTDLAVTQDGCRVVVANSNSCDLSQIDVQGSLDVAASIREVPAGGVVSGIIPKTVDGPLRARPHEIVIVPSSVPDKGDALCSATTEYRAFVSFPGCQLVAEIDLRSGMVVQGVMITETGYVFTDRPQCPAECLMRGESERVDAGLVTPDAGGSPDASSIIDAASETAPSMDAGVAVDSGTTEPKATANLGGVQPYGLALADDGSMLFVSSAGANFISMFKVDTTSAKLSDAKPIVLSGDNAQTLRLAVSPQTRQLGRFVYAIARDRSLRVISVDSLTECETNLDLARVPDGGIPLAQARCFAVGDATAPRRVTAEGSGIVFSGRAPQDVTFVNVAVNNGADGGVTNSDAGTMATPFEGIFAMVAVSDGSIYVIDVEDLHQVVDSSSTLLPQKLPHRIRNSLKGSYFGEPDAQVTSIGGGNSDGGVPVVVNKVAGEVLGGGGVFVRGIGEAIGSEWLMEYEPRMVERIAGQLRVTEAGLRLVDPGAHFCSSRVQGHLLDSGERLAKSGDIVVLTGCKETADCGPLQACRKPVTRSTPYGLCLDIYREKELFTRCSDYLKAEREFLVAEAADGSLLLDALPLEPQGIIKQETQPASPCANNADCENRFYCALADRPVSGKADFSISKGECFRPGCVTSDDCPTGFCEQPLAGGPKVCAAAPVPLEQTGSCKADSDCRATRSINEACNDDGDCDPLAECRLLSSENLNKTCVDRGMVCADYPGLKDVCVRPSSCFEELIRYQVRAGRSFLVGGYGRRTADPVTGLCQDDTKESTLFNNRVPVGLPVYPIVAGAECKEEVGVLKTPEPNPCFEVLTDKSYGGLIDIDSLTSDSVTHGPTGLVVRFGNPDIWFSLGLSHLWRLPTVAEDGDPPWYAPMPSRGLRVVMNVSSGAARLVISNSSRSLALPTRLLPGPDGNVYIVDTGDLSTDLGILAGQVRRLNQWSGEFDLEFQIK